MKKIIWVSGMTMVVALALGVAGFAYAQSQTPPTPEYPLGPGMMGGSFGYGRIDGYGMMGWTGEYGPMHDAMVATLSEALDLEPEEVETRQDRGETMWQIAIAEGLSVEEIQDLMLSVHDLALLEDAVADGLLTEAQAEWMAAHRKEMWTGKYGNDGFGGHCGGGWFNTNTRWQGEN